MSREFEFRIWSFLDKHYYYFSLEDGMPQGIAKGVSVPQQYSGLKDKRGTKIFEGDIVYFSYSTSEKDYETEIGEVFFSEGIFYFGKHMFASNDCNFSLHSVEVIGSLFKLPCKPDHNGECIHCDEPIDKCTFKSVSDKV